MTKIEFLKYLAKGWFGNSQQHSIHAQLLRERGYGAPADKIAAESDEEWEEAKTVNARLIELGEMPEVEIEKYPVITDIKKCWNMTAKKRQRRCL
jgi:bacterioferritin